MAEEKKEKAEGTKTGTAGTAGKKRKPRSKTVHHFALWIDEQGFIQEGLKFSLNSLEAMSFKTKPEAISRVKKLKYTFGAKVIIVDLIS